MAAATLAEIRQGIADNLDDVFGTTVQTSAYQLEQLMPPTIMVMGPDQVMYDRAMGMGMDEFIILIQGFGGTMLQGAQVVMDEWISATGTLSVKRAIESDKTLGGKVFDLQVMTMSSYRLFKFADGTVLLGCEWTTRVLNMGA